MSTETINTEQCADLLWCTEARVEELARNGELPGVKYGRNWIFVRADLLAYIAEKGRREAEARRLDADARKVKKSEPPAVKSRRQTPPTLPFVPAKVFASSQPP